MVEVKDISTEGKTCKIYQDTNETYVVEYINGELFVTAGAFSTEALAEAKGVELMGTEAISGEMLVGDVPVPAEVPAETPVEAPAEAPTE